MIQNPIYFSNILILSRRKILTIIFVLSCFGSYTYSGITTIPIDAFAKSNEALILQNLNNNHFNIYYLTPISYLKITPEKNTKPPTPSEAIMNKGIIKSKRLANFLINTNKNIDFNYAQLLAIIYIEEANHEGVNPDIAFAQMCLETGFLRFDGTVDQHQNNFCGLGVTGNGEKGHKFNSTLEGVRAHIQHLKAYASTNKLNNKLIDKRFNFVKRGCATHIDDLTGKWAVDVKYDHKIRNLLNRLYSYSS
jgi:hypothetical protein